MLCFYYLDQIFIWSGEDIYIPKANTVTIRYKIQASQVALLVRNQYLVLEVPLEEGMATYFRILAWRMLWTKEPGRLQSMSSLRVGHN